MRTRVLIAGLVTVLCLAVASSAFAEPKTVAPGNATTAQFISSANCGCHTPRVDEWKKSMHANALTDPIFLSKVEKAEAEAPGTAAFCYKCHGPVGTMTSEIGGTLSEVSKDAIGCMFCHQTVGLQGEPANVAHLVEADGQTRRAQIKEPQAPHPAVYSAFFESAEICGGCHNVNHPTTATHLEATYKEWKEGPYGDQNVVCQVCHMSETPGKIGGFSGEACTGGPQRDPIFRMSFVGANRILGPSDAGEAMLKSAAQLKVQVPEVVKPGEEASVTVTVSNVGAGHYLPTGLTEERQMWLSVVAQADDGSETDLGEIHYGTVLKDAEGNSPAEMWMAAGIESDYRIPPKESVDESFSFKMPEGADGAKIVATLNYKSVPDELAKEAGVENPQTEMAVAEAEVSAAAGGKAPAQPSEPATDTSTLPVWAWAAIGIVAVALIALIVSITRRKKTTE